MNTKKTTSVISAAVATALLGIIAAPVFAQTATINVSASTSVRAKLQANEANRLQEIISRSDTAITKRIDDLNKVNARIQALKNVSSTEKATVASEITTNINGLTALKAKIDADTDITTAQTDEKTITASFRIYELIMPQGYIASAADRVDTIVSMLTTVSTKLQARITADQSAGKDISTYQSLLNDLNAKLTDAKTQAENAQNGIANLVPDQGNKTQLAANTAALKSARADIKNATTDIQAARKDAGEIIKGLIQELRAIEPRGSATASSSVELNKNE